MTGPSPPASESASAPGETVPATAFHTVVAHFYRGEMTRMTVWRRRLDATTQWAILMSVALTTFALGSPEIPHYVLLLAVAFNSIFMVIEGRRYQHLHHAKWRLNLLERNYFAALFSAAEPQPEEGTWRRQLAADLRHRHFTLGLALAARLRLRKNYLMIGTIVLAVWVAKLLIHPVSATRLGELYLRMAIGSLLPGWLVAGVVLTLAAAAVLLAVLTPSEAALEEESLRAHSRLLVVPEPPSSAERAPWPPAPQA